MFRTLCSVLTRILTPPACINCGADGALLCARCQNNLHPKLRRIAGSPETFSCFSYTTPVVRALLGEWKYRANREAGALLCAQFSDALRAQQRAYKKSSTIVLPIPTRRSNRNMRGFSPPHVLAHAASAALGIPVHDGLRFVRRGKRQAELDLAKRRQNMHNALVLRGTLPHGAASGILIDDVRTTGATLLAAAPALQQRGVQDIHAITLAWKP